MIRSNEPEEIDVQNRSEHPALARRSAGWIEVIAGSMFSGKSEELIRRLRRAKIARQKIQVFKPEIDSRFSNDHIVSHSEIRHESANVQTSEDIRARIEPDTQVIGIALTLGPALKVRIELVIRHAPIPVHVFEREGRQLQRRRIKF